MAAIGIDLAELKRSVNLIALIESRGIALRKQGKNYLGHCPFHDDATPSLVVNPEENLWHCFGCPDNKGGDAIRFLELFEKLSFPEAVTLLQRETSGAPVPGNGRKPHGQAKPSSLNPKALLNRVAAFYHETLFTDPRGVDYLESRNLSNKELLTAFRIGFANGTLLETLPEAGELREALVAIGILSKSGAELFRDCVTFPLTNEDGQVVGLYGRKIHEKSATPHLYLPGPHQGLFNRQAALHAKEILLTESILDALSLYQAGFRNVIPCYGTNGFTADHRTLFTKQGIRKVFFCFDNDEAGRAGATRIAEKLSDHGIASSEILLPVKDANEYFKTHEPEDFVKLLSEALVESEPEKALPGEDGFSITLGGVSYIVRLFRSRGEELRVNLRASFGGLLHLDTLDLYSHRARQSFVNLAAKKFQLPPEEIGRQLERLVMEAEAFTRLRGNDEEPVKEKSPAAVMTPAEESEALAFLRSPNLAEEILKDLDRCGYVGEDANKLLTYLIGISRKLEKPMSAILISQSGAGKSQLAEFIESLTPPEEVVLYSRLSPQALCYMEKDFLKRKLLIIEEKTGSDQADYSIRTLQSRQKITQGVVMKDPQTGRMYTKTTVVEGPIAYLVTTTGNVPMNHENLTRSFEIELDESREQTERIHRRQREARTLEGLFVREGVEAIRRKHHNAQRLLSGVRVVIPFALELTFPSAWLRSRRDQDRFLSLIEAVTFLHQHQREKKMARDENGNRIDYIESTLDDYRIAYDLGKEILAHTFHELSKGARELLVLIEEMVAEKSLEKAVEPSEVGFTRRMVREHSSWPDYRLKESFKELEDLEYLMVVSARNGKASQYQLPAILPEKVALLSGLTTPEELSGKLTGRKPGGSGSNPHGDAVCANR